MDKDKLKERLLATFLGELEEHVRLLEANALALERGDHGQRPEILNTVFRTAHSLKGAARSAGVPSVAAICHELEEALSQVRDGSLPVDDALVQRLLSTADALAEAGRSVREQRASPRRAEETERSAAAVAHGAPPIPGATEQGASSWGVGGGFVRLPAAKLDALVARSGELLIARRRAAGRAGDLAALRETLRQCLSEWRRLETPIRRASEDGQRSRIGLAGKPVALSRRALAAAERTGHHLRRLERDLERVEQGILADHHLIHQAASPLDEAIRGARMLPFAEVCEGLERAVRDLAKASNKQVELVVEGSDVELDRAILAALHDPLLHLVRNAVDHGIEPPAERLERGKPPVGRITVAAALKGPGVEIMVADDGRGLDIEAIRERASKQNVPASEDESELVRLIYAPGFSTSKLVTELSGRGIGLDVVKHQVEAVHGHVDVAFEPGRRTRFVLTLPLTLTTIRALMVEVAGDAYAVPTTFVKRLVRASAKELGWVEGREVLLGGGAPIPVASLADLLGLGGAPRVADDRRISLVVMAAADREVAFAVDELIAEHEVVVKNLGRRIQRVRSFAGATVLPTGRPALILAPAELLEAALGRSPGQPVGSRLTEERTAPKKRVLVVDDSITTRTLEKSILEAAGYEVLAAPDGAEAWRLLQEEGADLVVADVEMPRLDGFGLTETIRSSKRFRDLPVVLVTALESEHDKARGLEAGADAYLPKSTFDQEHLLAILARLV